MDVVVWVIITKGIDKERYLHLLDFSTPKTEEELHPPVEEKAAEPPAHR